MDNARLYHNQQMIAEELRALVRNYRDLFESASDAIWIHDMEGDIVTANRAASRLTKYDLEEIPGLNTRSFLSEESLALAREVKVRLLDGEELEQAYDQQLIRKDGREANLKLTTSLITRDGQPIGFQNIARDVTAEKRMEENLRLYVQQVTRVQEEERKRIARELHDDTAQALIGLSRQIDNLAHSNTSLSKSEAGFLEDLLSQLSGVLDGIRRLSQDLRPSILDDLGLYPSLEWLVDELKMRYNIEASLKVIGMQRRLQPEMELILFRVAQEALTNIGKHAQTSRADVTMEFGEDRIKMTVSDNGRGFELKGPLNELSRSGKLGLAGMQERVQLVGGRLSIQSEVGKGTTVIAEVPRHRYLKREACGSSWNL
jgi:PAS domain S-box-containing protein